MNNKDNLKQIYKLFEEVNLIYTGRLGSQFSGRVYEVKKMDKDKKYAAKLIEKFINLNEIQLISKTRGLNITKLHSIYERRYENRNIELCLLIMEKADLKDLKTFVNYLRKHNILNYIFQNPFEIMGDIFTRYIVKQLLKGFETLYLANYTHFDFKPENTLSF